MNTLDLVAVGDISLAGGEGLDPFEHVAKYLRPADIVFGNLECAFCDAGEAAEKEIVLRAAPARASSLQHAGFHVVNVANNHALDFGPAGLHQTLTTLRERGIHTVGTSRRLPDREHVILERHRLTVGFLGYCETDRHTSAHAHLLNPIDPVVMSEQLRNLKPHCHVVVVSLHWGIEYSYYPSPDRIELARELVHRGAALVLGHHPLVLQGIETIGTGLIAYSLGSFQLQPRRPQSRQSLLLHARLGPRGVERYRTIPVLIDKENRPRLVRGQERVKARQFMERISAPIRQDRVTEKWWFEQTASEYLRVNLRAWVTRVRRYGVRHLMPFLRWLLSAFTIKCCLGLWRARRSV